MFNFLKKDTNKKEIDVENNIANGRVKRNTDDYDDDLNPILEKASNEQLQPLVEIITGAFSNFLEIEEAYKAHHPNHVMYADLIASELRTFGGIFLLISLGVMLALRIMKSYVIPQSY